MLFFCQACNRAYVIGGPVEEIKYLVGNQESYPCITPLCAGRLLRIEIAPSGSFVHELPIKSFYRAINGFGTGEGEGATLDRVRDLLLTNPIVEVRAEEIGSPERVIIHLLVLRDGTRLHLAASSRGACIYYVEQAGNSCLKEVDRELRPHNECPAENREEGGRSPGGTTSGPESGTREVAASSTANNPGPSVLSAMPVAGYIPSGYGGR